MSAAPLRLAISPCPNDTFVFHAWIHGLVDGPPVSVRLQDIETLNDLAARGEADVVKISVAAYGALRDRYALLHAGGAAGLGVGPLLVAAAPREPGGVVAIPGRRTTAALLLRLLGEFETVEMRFDRIEDAVSRGEVDCGVLIHEGRFTYEGKGLVKLRDLGEVWEERMQLPIPLGAIAVRRDLGATLAREVDEAIRASVRRAWKDPAASEGYVRAHAQEMDPEVVRRHIELYVNDFTLDLSGEAVERLLALGAECGLYGSSARGLFAHP